MSSFSNSRVAGTARYGIECSGLVSAGSQSIRCCTVLILPRCPSHISANFDSIAVILVLCLSKDEEMFTRDCRVAFSRSASLCSTAACCNISVSRLFDGL